MSFDALLFFPTKSLAARSVWRGDHAEGGRRSDRI